MMKKRLTPYFKGFTLAELLVVLTVLGIISTFTIPKILVATRDKQYNATAKEFASVLAQAYTLTKANKGITANTTLQDLLTYMNTLSGPITAEDVDDSPGWGSYNCGWGGRVCYTLQSGAKINFNPAMSFGGTGVDNGIWMIFDPDGISDGVSGSATFYVRYNGRVQEVGDVTGNGIQSSMDCFGGACFSYPSPSWFRW